MQTSSGSSVNSNAKANAEPQGVSIIETHKALLKYRHLKVTTQDCLEIVLRESSTLICIWKRRGTRPSHIYNLIHGLFCKDHVNQIKGIRCFPFYYSNKLN